MYTDWNSIVLGLDGLKRDPLIIILLLLTKLFFRLIPSLTQSHTKPRTETVREEVILAKEGISLKDNFFSPYS